MTRYSPKSFTPEEWAEKEATVSVTIQQAQRMTPAALDDELAKKMGAETIGDLTSRVTEMISSRKTDSARREQGDELFKALLEQTSFDLPPKLVAAMIEDNLNQLVQRELANNSDKDEAALQEEFKGEAESAVDDQLRRTLIMDAVADKFDVQATQQDLNQQIYMAAYQSGRSPEEVSKQLQESGRIYEVMADIRQHKAIEVLLDKVLGETEEDSAESDESKANEEAETAAAE